MTIQQILDRLEPHKPMTRVTLYVWLRRAKVKPVSRFRQNPQQYPNDTATRVLEVAGLKTSKNKAPLKR